MKRKSIQITAAYSVLHFLVDGICAYAMFSRFMQSSDIYINVLLYNFCAFALQMPLGTFLDMLEMNNSRKNIKRRFDNSMFYAASGVGITLIGAYTSPLILGLGNALFHVGGGVGTIHEDFNSNLKGQALGVFVAPGAFGLYLGTQLASFYGLEMHWLPVLLCVVVAIPAFLILGRILSGVVRLPHENTGINIESSKKENLLPVFIGCFIVVVIRSYVGMAVSMPWKTTLALGTVSVLAVVFGKMAGGFLAAKLGACKTTIVTLLIAAAGFMFSDMILPGLLALFMFNMTMPITLYQLVRRLKIMPGFSFGLLTFGLFLGFLPDYFDVVLPLSGSMIGVLGSLFSIILLLPTVQGDDNTAKENN